jgi:hypothetical protein
MTKSKRHSKNREKFSKKEKEAIDRCLEESKRWINNFLLDFAALPKPDHEYGYSKPYLESWLKSQKINKKKFWEAFGRGNTCTFDEKLGTIVYPVDVEKALFELGHKAGLNHLWD